MSSEDETPLHETCYSVIETILDNRESFQLLCPDGSFTNSDVDFKCIKTLTKKNSKNMICPSSVTFDNVTHTNIRLIEGTPNACNEGVDANGISNCLDPDTGAPINGYLVEPTCTVVIATTYGSCDGILTENSF